DLLAPERERLAGPQARQDREPLVETLRADARIRLLAEQSEARVVRIAESDAEDQAPAGELVDAGRLPREVPRPPACERRHLDADPHALGRDSDRRERDPRVAGRNPAIALIEDVILEEDAVPSGGLGAAGELD